MTLLEIKSMGDRNSSPSPGWSTGNGGSLDYGTPGRWAGSWFWNGGFPIFSIPLPADGVAIVVGYAFRRFQHYVVPISFRSGGIDQITVTHDMASGVLNVHRGTTSGPVIATIGSAANNPLPANVWKYIEHKVVIHDTNGRYVLRIDGQTVIDFTGDTAFTAGATQVQDIFMNTSGHLATQDLYILDSNGAAPHNDFLGDVRVDWLPPIGNGEFSQLLGSDGNSVDNWQLVDESPANTSDYAGSATDGLQDLYQVTDVPVAANKIVYGVKALASAFKDDAGPASMQVVVKETTSGEVYTGPEKILSITQTQIASPIRQRKIGGALFTVADINAMQVGAITGDGVL